MMRRLYDLVIPAAALHWGMLTKPGPVGRILSTQRLALAILAEAALRQAAQQRALEFDAAFEQVRQIMQTTGTEIADMQAKVEAWAAEQRENSNWRSTGP